MSMALWPEGKEKARLMEAGRAMDSTVKKKRQCGKHSVTISLLSRRLLVASKTNTLVFGPGFPAKPIELLITFPPIILPGRPNSGDSQ